MLLVTDPVHFRMHDPFTWGQLSHYNLRMSLEIPVSRSCTAAVALSIRMLETLNNHQVQPNVEILLP